MFQRRCAVSMPWRQRILSARSSRAHGGAHDRHIISAHHLTRVLPVATSTTNHSWNYPLRHLSSSPRHAETTMNITGNIARPVSEAQRRNAQLELGRMNRSTSRLLDIYPDSGTVSEVTVNEARVALHYWSRRWYMHFHPGFGRAAKGSALSMGAMRKKWDSKKQNNGGNGNGINIRIDGTGFSENEPAPSAQSLSGDHGARQAERLLDWSLSHNLVPLGVFDHSDETTNMKDEDREGGNLGASPNLTCVNIIETHLLPTAYGGIGGFGNTDTSIGHSGGGHSPYYNGHSQNQTTPMMLDQFNHATLNKHFTVNSSFVCAVVDATRVMNKMKQLQSDFPNHLSPDTLSIKAELNVWSKRAIILGQSQNVSVGGIAAGNIINGVAKTSNPKEMLMQLEMEDGKQLYENDAYTLQGCLDKMEYILSQAEEQYISTNDEQIHPSVDWYNHVLGALAKSDLAGALNKTKQILNGMEAYRQASKRAGMESISENEIDEHATDGNLRQCWASPDTVSYNSVIFCLSRDPGKSTAAEAEKLLQNMNEQYNESNDANGRPDAITYGAVLHALAQAGMANEAERILESLEYGGQGDIIVPSLTIYNTVLNAWASSFQRNASKRAESLLERMKVLSSTGKNTTIEPDAISMSTVMSCLSRSRTRYGAERAEQLLNEAIAMYNAGNSRVKPDSIMFNCAIAGWTNISGIKKEQEGVSNNFIPAERAESLLRKMKDCKLDVQPVVQTFNIILDCWAKSVIAGAAERSLKLWREMPEYGVTPDDYTYNAVLHAMTKENDPKWVKCAEDIFQEMKEKLPVSEITYHVMMNLYGKSTNRDGARKAEEMLRNMEKEKLMLSDISMNICIDAYARRGNHIKAESLLEEMIELSDQGKAKCRPTIHSFASVVNALAKSGDVNAVARAEEVVRKVEELEYVNPNSILYNSLIDCIVKSRNKGSALQAEKILHKMEQMNRLGNSDVCPSPYSYSMVLTLCARNNEPGAAERAERILMNIEKLHAEGLSDAVANSRCYSAAISAWARSSSSNAVERAFALIDRMEKNGRDNTPHGKPNSHCYNACIHAIAKSYQPGKERQCGEVLQRMIEAKDAGFHEAAPSLITYSTIINACAFTHGNEADGKVAFDLARTCFQTLLESNDMEPCASSFANFFLVISRHLKHGAIRDEFAEAIFLEGCKRGKINRHSLKNFQKASPSAAKRLTSESRSLPVEWGQNIKSDGHKSY